MNNNRLHLRTFRYTLEIAVSTPDEAITAAANGADRLELSSGLEIGGLTPSLYTYRAVRETVSIPVYVLIRPRPGGFQYSDREFDVMLHDATEFVRHGASGIVFGITTTSGIDRVRCRKLVEIANRQAVFHRAFDFLTEPREALDELIDLGFERVLTSGQGVTAATGTACLASLLKRAAKKIEVLPGGNIRPENVVDLIQKTSCEQVHSSARNAIPESELCGSPKLAAAMGVDQSGNRLTTNASIVAALRNALDRLANKPLEDNADVFSK